MCHKGYPLAADTIQKIEYIIILRFNQPVLTTYNGCLEVLSINPIHLPLPLYLPPPIDIWYYFRYNLKAEKRKGYLV